MKKLIKNGYIVSMDKNIGEIKNCDILIDGENIIDVRPNIELTDCDIIKADNMIVLPGFVDTHRHTWQTQLRSVAANWTLFDYLAQMRSAYSGFYDSEDGYLGNHIGALESINAGITTIVDHCHLINSPEHADRLTDGLDDSGIRAVFCYGFSINPKFNPFSMEKEPGWRYDDIKRMRNERLFSDNARVILGVNPSECDNSEYDDMVNEIELCRELGVNLISYHVKMGYYDSGRDNLARLGRAGYFKDDMIFVHGSTLTDEELDMMAYAGVGISTTPETEMQMAMGHPVAFKAMARGIKASIGVDIVSNYSAEMFTQMRLLLQHQRSLENDIVAQSRRMIPGKIQTNSKDVLYLSTQGGADAIGLGSKIGSITPGKKADIQLIRANDINMLPINNVIDSIIFYANVSNIDTVIVDGKILKQAGKLQNINWASLSDRMQKSADKIIGEFKKVDLQANVDLWQNIFGHHVSLD